VKCPAPIRFSLLAPAILAIAACQQAGEPAPQEREGVPAGPEAKPGLSASGGVLVLPAVTGRPGAAYFTLSNNGENAAELAAVHIEGAARAEMHETKGGSMAKLDALAVPAGESVAFARGGKHVMAFELDGSLKAGATTEMTLTFADGDKLSTPLTIEAMGGMGAMEHAGHGESH